MDLITSAPSLVRMRPKSKWHPSAVDKSIRQGLLNSRFNPGTMVVLHDGEAVALTYGEHTGEMAFVTHINRRQWCGFNTYADLNNAAKNGQQFRVVFSKPTASITETNCWFDMWPTVGLPGAGDYSGTAAQLRKFDNTTVGGVQCSITPGGGQTRHLVSWGMANVNSSNGVNVRSFILYDRVAAYDGCTITTSTTTLDNSTGPAARYVSAGQDGLMICITCSTAGAGTASALSSMTLTDQQGNTGVSLAPGWTLSYNATSFTPTATIPSEVICPWDVTNGWQMSPWLPLPANVAGVRKVEAFASSANNASQVASMDLIKPLGSLWCGGSGVRTGMELSRSMFTLERIYSDACMSMLLLEGAASASDTLADLRLVHG